jgi:hypothetical protein
MFNFFTAIINFIEKNKMSILFMLFGLIVGYYVFHNDPKTVTIEREVKVEVIKYDTINIEHRDTVIKYMKIKPDTLFIMTDSTYIDSLYKEFAEQIKAGNVPYSEDSVHFGKDFLQTRYTFPPMSKFDYKFKAGDDSIIHETITITRTIDKTPKLSIFVGGITNVSSENKIERYGAIAGLKVKNIGFHGALFDNKSKQFGVTYYWPK